MNELYLVHHGVQGQKWGVRRYQNPDGTLTPAGKIHYGASEYDAKTKESYKNRHSTKTYGEYQDARNSQYANTAAKLFMRKGNAEKYANDVKNGEGKAKSFIKNYASSYLKDAAVYTLSAAGAGAAGTIIAGPYGGYLAAELTVYGLDTAKKASRIYRTGKYVFGK